MYIYTRMHIYAFLYIYMERERWLIGHYSLFSDPSSYILAWKKGEVVTLEVSPGDKDTKYFSGVICPLKMYLWPACGRWSRKTTCLVWQVSRCVHSWGILLGSINDDTDWCRSQEWDWATCLLHSDWWLQQVMESSLGILLGGGSRGKRERLPGGKLIKNRKWADNQIEMGWAADVNLLHCSTKVLRAGENLEAAPGDCPSSSGCLTQAKPVL